MEPLPGLGCQADGQQTVVSKVRVVGRLVVKARMCASAIVEIEISTDGLPRLRHGVVGSQVDLLVFDRTPQALDQDVVPPSPFAVHADLDVVRRQHAGEGSPGKLAALVRIEDLRLAVAGQCVLQCLDAESRLHRDRQAPRQNLPCRPVEHLGMLADSRAARFVADAGGSPTKIVQAIMRRSC